jgi:hypothetical protein
VITLWRAQHERAPTGAAVTGRKEFSALLRGRTCADVAKRPPLTISGPLSGGARRSGLAVR